MKNLKMTASAVLIASLLLSGCAAANETPASDSATGSEQQTQSSQGQALSTRDTWAKASTESMSAAFGVLENKSASAIELVSVTDLDQGGEIQIHDTVGQSTGAKMVKHEGGLVINPGSELVLEPGGTHLMYMSLTKPLVASRTSTLRLSFADGSSQDVEFSIRNFTGANESYHEGSADHR